MANKFVTILVWLMFSAGLYASPVTVELAGGSKLTGEIVRWDGQVLVFKSEMGTVELKGNQLSADTLQRSRSSTSADSDRIKELEGIIESLRRDNAALRAQLQGQSTAGSTLNISEERQPISHGQSESSSEGFWITSTGKRHNQNCRYYRTSRGRSAGANEGVACKICGG